MRRAVTVLAAAAGAVFVVAAGIYLGNLAGNAFACWSTAASRSRRPVEYPVLDGAA